MGDALLFVEEGWSLKQGLGAESLGCLGPPLVDFKKRNEFEGVVRAQDDFEVLEGVEQSPVSVLEMCVPNGKALSVGSCSVGDPLLEHLWVGESEFLGHEDFDG